LRQRKQRRSVRHDRPRTRPNITTPVVDMPSDPPAGTGSALVDVSASGGAVVGSGPLFPRDMMVVLVKVGLVMTRVTTLGCRIARLGVASLEGCVEVVPTA